MLGRFLDRCMFMSEITIEIVRTFGAHSDDPRLRLALISHRRGDSLTRHDTIRVKEKTRVDYPVSTVCERDFVSQVINISRIVSLIYATL